MGILRSLDYSSCLVQQIRRGGKPKPEGSRRGGGKQQTRSRGRSSLPVSFRLLKVPYALNPKLPLRSR